MTHANFLEQQVNRIGQQIADAQGVLEVLRSAEFAEDSTPQQQQVEMQLQFLEGRLKPFAAEYREATGTVILLNGREIA